jgi:hypothetical protein
VGAEVCVAFHVLQDLWDQHKYCKTGNEKKTEVICSKNQRVGIGSKQKTEINLLQFVTIIVQKRGLGGLKIPLLEQATKEFAAGRVKMKSQTKIIPVTRKLLLENLSLEPTS